VYADDFEANTEQELEQKNVCTGFVVCTNHGQTIIKHRVLTPKRTTRKKGPFLTQIIATVTNSVK
jgi:hypothetical protein